MTRKLLIFDLDDTLLTSEKIIAPSSIKAIEACKSKGMVIGYITARARTMQHDIDNGKVFFTDRYNLPKDFIAYYNGAVIYSNNVLIGKNVIPYKKAMQIIRKLVNVYPDSKIGVYHEPWSFLKRGDSIEGENWNLETGEKIKCSIFNLLVYDVQRIRIEFAGYDDKNKLNGILTNDTTYFINADGSAMIINKDATKENALKIASEYFNIPNTDIISFGDDINDLNMLKISGVGVAMGNAIDAIKNAADYITETNDNEGISIWINKYLLSPDSKFI